MGAARADADRSPAGGPARATPTERHVEPQREGGAAARDAEAAESEAAGPAVSADEPVTVTITNYNGAAWLETALAAVAALRGTVAEVIVVDNASTDDSLDVVRRVAPEARVVALAENLGPCPARNRGLEEARTRWVLQIDNDVVVRPDTLERLLTEAALPGVVAVQPRAVLESDPSVVHYDGASMHFVGVMCLRHLLAAAPEVETSACDVDAVISMALLLDREVVLAEGGYDEAFFILFEDHDLSYRLRALGYRLRLAPRAVVLHREGTAGLSFRPGAAAYPERRAYLHGRNRAYLVVKNYGLGALVLSWPGRALFGLAWLVFAAKSGVLGPHLRGRIDAWRLLGRALAARRRLAGRRRVADRHLLGADRLTFSPVIRRTGPDAILESALDRALAAWWRLARGLLPRGCPEPRARPR